MPTGYLGDVAKRSMTDARSTVRDKEMQAKGENPDEGCMACSNSKLETGWD